MTSDRLHTDDLIQDDADQPVARDDAGRDSDQDSLEPLFASGRSEELHAKWQALQARFVDDPRDTVEEADALVAELLDELAREFSTARSDLERQWSEGEDVSTEDLRLTLRRYRSFFERLLAV
jgi:hypothetical protein